MIETKYQVPLVRFAQFKIGDVVCVSCASLWHLRYRTYHRGT